MKNLLSNKTLQSTCFGDEQGDLWSGECLGRFYISDSI